MKHIHMKSCKSTFEVLKDNYNYESILVSCEEQTSGRGRGSNTWDFFEGSIAMSLNLVPTEILTLTSIEMGVLTCHFFKAHYNLDLSLKWPNDIILNGKKVGGLLIESFKDTYLLGIGLNVIIKKDEALNRNYKFKAASIFNSDFELIKKDLSFKICKYIHSNRIKDMTVITEEFKKLCFHTNMNIEIYDGDNIKGQFLGVNTDGSAIVKTNLETKSIYSGSLRLLI